MLRTIALMTILVLAAACTPGAVPTPAPGTPGTPGTPAPGTPGTPVATPGATPPAGDDGSEVSIVDNRFVPPTIEVSTGTTVTWTHEGNLPHTVTFADGLDSGVISTGGTYERTFNQAGSFDYVCTIHSGMAGTITVQ